MRLVLLVISFKIASHLAWSLQNFIRHSKVIFLQAATNEMGFEVAIEYVFNKPNRYFKNIIFSVSFVKSFI